MDQRMSLGNENWKTGERAERIIEDLKNGRPQFETIADSIKEAQLGAATRMKALAVSAVRDASQKCGRENGWAMDAVGRLLNYMDAGLSKVDPGKVAEQT